MVRFSCFNAHVHSHKSKKPIQPASFDNMVKLLHSFSQKDASPNSMDPSCLASPPPVQVKGQTDFGDNVEHVTTPSSGEHDVKSEDMSHRYLAKSDTSASPTRCLRRSLSLGCNLDEDKRIFGGNDQEDSPKHNELSWHGSQYHDEAEYSEPTDLKSLGTTTDHHDQHLLAAEYPLISDKGKNKSVFTSCDPEGQEKEFHPDHETHVYFGSACDADDSGSHTPRTPPKMAKCCSMPNFDFEMPDSGGSSPQTPIIRRNRSSEDFSALDSRRNDHSGHGEHAAEFGRDREEISQDVEGDNESHGGYDSYAYANKDWIIPAPDEIKIVPKFQGESSTHRRDQHPGQDFKIKRIEDWVTDLQHCGPGEDVGEFPDLHQENEGALKVLDVADAGKLESKKDPAMEAAKIYISSLNPAATTAQLSNHGLVVIPFLSPFLSLKVLNLSGNAIARITSGALPRGLHMLNLSKNKISTIEGLRDLTRLRVLDLSYNKITRIGRGLASCSSLRELYLAGNKISEVEGLHRLLKLTVLDLRFNKISTTKCLGQLAANYNTLQAISLEGNPAQKNVGDEQLKKYLLGLLPHLAYYNRQAVKSSSLKDSADRAVRLGMGAHQFDRGHKSTRRGSHGVSALKQSSSSLNPKGQAADSPKRSRGSRHRHHTPPSRSNAGHRQHDFSSKLLNLRSVAAMHKSRSESTLAAM